MDGPFPSTTIPNTDELQSPVKQDYIWPAFAPSHTLLAPLDARSNLSSLTSSPNVFSNQVCTAREILLSIKRKIVFLPPSIGFFRACFLL
jgi:hypothetical protein